MSEVTGERRSRSNSRKTSKRKMKSSHSNRRSLKNNVHLDDVFNELQQEVKGTKPILRRDHFRYLIVSALCIVAITFVGGGVSKDLNKKPPDTSLLRGQQYAVYQKAPTSEYPLDAQQKVMPVVGPQLNNLGDPNRQHRILALGGSTTWGSKLESREDAFPSVLAKKLGPNWKALNLAVRATGAFYASQCIETMVEEVVGTMEDISNDFDVIILEYSLNGLDGVTLLVERLRRRYPDAIVVYVHLWSLRMVVDNTKTGESPRAILQQGHKFTEADNLIQQAFVDTPSDDWGWSNNMIGQSTQVSMDAFATVRKVDGYLYKLPKPENPKDTVDGHWFGQDKHHLSTNGHEVVAQGLHALLKLPSTVAPPKVINAKRTWGKGDQCSSWYETGVSLNVNFNGGTMKMFVKPDKYALHVGQNFGSPAFIEFNNISNQSQPLNLVIMSWGAAGASVYPKVNVKLSSIDKASTTQPQISEIDPLNPDFSQRIYHVMRSINIGFAKPGQNIIELEPIETTERPLRITGIVMCGACVEMDNL